jgi:hypothetical protein
MLARRSSFELGKTAMTTREKTLALINAFTDEPQLIREIATWCITANAYDTIDGDEAEDTTYMDALRAQWHDATEDEITLGHKLALAVVEVVKTQPIKERGETEGRNYWRL